MWSRVDGDRGVVVECSGDLAVVTVAATAACCVCVLNEKQERVSTGMEVCNRMASVMLVDD